MAQSQNIPIRLHHNAYVTRDQEKTRQFYEDLIGLPLVATWCESDELFGKVRTYCHTFYEMGDGGALAFFQFEDPADQEEFGPKMPASPFHHIALKVNAETQRAIEERIAAAGIQAAGHLRAGARLLPLRVRDGSQRVDPRVHARSSRSGSDCA